MLDQHYFQSALHVFQICILAVNLSCVPFQELHLVSFCQHCLCWQSSSSLWFFWSWGLASCPGVGDHGTDNHSTILRALLHASLTTITLVSMSVSLSVFHLSICNLVLSESQPSSTNIIFPRPLVATDTWYSITDNLCLVTKQPETYNL